MNYSGHLVDEEGNQYYLENNILTAYLSSDYVVKATNTYEQIPLNQKMVIGKKLTLDAKGKIIIGKGIRHVKISAKIQLTGGEVVLGAKNIVVRKNSEVISRGMFRIFEKANCFYSLPMLLENVEENDEIALFFYGMAGENISSGKAFTNLTVEGVP